MEERGEEKQKKGFDASSLIDRSIGAAAGSEEEKRKLGERLKRNERVREKKRREKKVKREEKEAKEEERRRVEEEESRVVGELNREAEEGKEDDVKFIVDIGMRKVTIMKSLLRNEPKSSLYEQAVKSEGGRELVCLMDESTWSVIFKWLNT